MPMVVGEDEAEPVVYGTNGRFPGTIDPEANSAARSAVPRLRAQCNAPRGEAGSGDVSGRGPGERGSAAPNQNQQPKTKNRAGTEGVDDFFHG